MKRGPGMTVEVPGRWEAETEAQLIEFVRNVRANASQDEAVRLVAEWLQSSRNQEMRHTSKDDIVGVTEKVRVVSTDEEAVNVLRRRFAPLVGDRLYGELADMSEGHGTGKE